MIHCVTTMSKEYYDFIGKLMIKSWMKFFPDNCKLYLYLEDFSIETDDTRIIKCDWNNEIIPLYSQWSIHQSAGSENHRSHKFTKKAMAQIAIWNKLSNSKILWLDADLVFLKTLPDNFFEAVLGDYPLASWGNGSFESGTVFVNTAHSDWIKIKEIYESIYFYKIEFPRGNDQQIIYPSGWLDGEILGYAAATSGVKYLNLNSLCKAKTNTPLNHSWLGEYMIHFKAKRKNMLEDVILNQWGREDLYKMYIED